MAYPGTKKTYGAWLKSSYSQLKYFPTIVDPFFGGGGLSSAWIDAFGKPEHLIVAESFAPLRSLYKEPPTEQELLGWGEMFLELIDYKSLDWDALSDEWSGIGSIIKDGPGFFDSPEVCRIAEVWGDLRSNLKDGNRRPYVTLQSLGAGNSMRHGKRGHNIAPDPAKIVGLAKRVNPSKADAKCSGLISPVCSVAVDNVYVHWQSAIEHPEKPVEAVALIDPPYLGGEKIYPNEDALACAGPPVELACRRGYGAIVAFNYYSIELDCLFRTIALAHGYTIDMKETQFTSKCNQRGDRKADKAEYCWVLTGK